ncbi:MAG: hypothetical protein P1P84_11790 [Deferrisomatales bacterium]|nr:hypothetical protein [Deferrisomatales bacterium]
MKVRKVSSPNSTAVVGVVDRAFEAPDDQAGEPIPPGAYLSVVTLGAYAAMKVDAGNGRIEVGDLLVSSGNPGHAMKSDHPGVGTVIGKALEALDEGVGPVRVVVTLQ